MGFPARACAAANQASARVGCAWIVAHISSNVSSARRATVASAISSVAQGPTACAPRSWPVSASATYFTKPWGSARAKVFPSEARLHFPVLTTFPCCRASSSHRPTLATSVDVKTPFGIDCDGGSELHSANGCGVPSGIGTNHR
jgi:hypothetical protein